MESLKKFYDLRDKEIKDVEAKRGKQTTKDGANKLFYFVQVFVESAKGFQKPALVVRKREGVRNIDQFE